MDLGLLVMLDGTARITLEGKPLLFAGVVDIAQHFHLTGGALVDSEVRPVSCCLFLTSRPPVRVRSARVSGYGSRVSVLGSLRHRRLIARVRPVLRASLRPTDLRASLRPTDLPPACREL